MAKAGGYRAIAAALKKRICTGSLARGSRLPSRTALIDEFAVSSVTMQRALDRLVDQGFVVVDGHRGTFVVEHPPNLARYALVLPNEPGKGSWNRFLATALREAEGWRDDHGRRFSLYCISGADPASEGHARLCADIADGLLAGIVFITTPWYLGASPAFSVPLPRVIIGGEPDNIARFDASLVSWGHDVMIHICRAFADDGRRRMAALVDRNLAQRWREYLPIIEQAGLTTRDSWWIYLPTETGLAECSRGVARLLLDRPIGDRPDALYISDDNLVPHATAGVIDSGVQLPSELSVIGHANLPLPTRSVVPCRRFGPDMRHLLARALAEMVHLRAGGAHRQVTVEQMMFDQLGQ